MHRKEKTIVERTPPKAIKRPKVVGNIEEINATKVVKRAKVVGNIEEPKANRVDGETRTRNPWITNPVL